MRSKEVLLYTTQFGFAENGYFSYSYPSHIVPVLCFIFEKNFGRNRIYVSLRSGNEFSTETTTKKQSFQRQG